MAGHALELFLKTFLLSRGMGEAELRRQPYGHDLNRLLTEASRRGLGTYTRLSPQLESDISKFSSVYSKKVLEYFSILHLLGPPTLPDLTRIRRFLRRLDEVLPDIIQHGAQQLAAADPAGGRKGKGALAARMRENEWAVA